MKRIFTAIRIEPGNTFLELISSLKAVTWKDGIKWTNVDNLHITIAFLGDTEESIIKSVIQMLKEHCSGFSPFELQMKGTGVFRNFSDPRIIWTGISHSEILQQLYNLIYGGLKNLNIHLGEKTFNPHITLGRIKHLNDKESFKKIVEQYSATDIQTIPVNEVILYESILLPAGPVYKPVIKIAL